MMQSLRESERGGEDSALVQEVASGQGHCWGSVSEEWGVAVISGQ